MVETVYRIPGAPRIAHLSDLHGRDPAPILASLRRHPFDLIAITGDVMYCSWPTDNRSPLETQEHVLPFLRGCAAIAPTFLSLGNHEQVLHPDDIQTISATGVTVLDNSYQSITVDGKTVVIGGLTSAYVIDYRKATIASRTASNRYPKKESIDGLEGLRTASERVPDVAWLSSFAAVPGYHVLLSHHPEYFNLVPDSVELVLSGHAHGGQIRLYNPFKREWRGVFAPGQGMWPRWTNGVYENRLVVSAGLSNTARVPRFFNPTEVVFINCSSL